jgi:Protein of unknown function (DUF2752)
MTIVWRPLRPREIDHEVLWLAVSGAVLVGAAIVIRSPNVQLPLCALKVLTGLPCPTCGLTRAVLAVTRGDLAAALFFNPLALVAGVASALYLAYAATVLALRLPRFRPRLSPADARVVRATSLALLLANWVWLIATGR